MPSPRPPRPPRPLRRLRAALLAAALLAGATAGSGAAVPEPPSVTVVQYQPQLEFELPLYVGNAADGTHRLFVLEQDGCMWAIHQPSGRKTLALNLSDVVHHPHQGYTEEGLLAAAFHPRFATHPMVYLWYCLSDPRRTVLSAFRMDPDHPDQVLKGSEQRLLEVAQPFPNHKGATLMFGPDGYLYVSLGDGGGAGDPHGNAQNLGALLGKILRLDVDHSGPATPYAIPSDNPFVGQDGARGEIWAYGLRNVWRMSFDRQNGELWAGDVGQDKWEEIDIITRGGNYGWNIREGSHPFRGEQVGGLIDPIFDYGHDVGRCVIGGYVYRGKAYPALRGWYLYGDFANGKIWALKRDEHGLLACNQEVADLHVNITSFGEDEEGELYATVFDGHLYRIQSP
jgi:glucose/arabinose dehydrogenase